MPRSVLTLDFGKTEPTDASKADEFRRIADMIADGFTSGEILGEDSNGFGYSGWWDLAEIES